MCAVVTFHGHAGGDPSIDALVMESVAAREVCYDFASKHIL